MLIEIKEETITSEFSRDEITIYAVYINNVRRAGLGQKPTREKVNKLIVGYRKDSARISLD